MCYDVKHMSELYQLDIQYAIDVCKIPCYSDLLKTY